MPSSADHWRIVDHARVESEGFGLLGFVRRLGDYYETSLPGRDLERSYFSTLQAAMNSLAF